MGLKLALTTALILGVTAALGSWLLLEDQRQQVFERKERAARRQAEQVALVLAAPLEFDDDLAIAEALKSVEDDPDLVALRVLDRDRAGAVAGLGADIDPPALPSTPPTIAWEPDMLWLVWPIGEPAEPQGTLILALSLASETAEWEAQRNLILAGCGSLALILAGLIIAATRKMVLVPLSRLSAAADAFARGEPVDVPPAGSDEVGRLTQTFVAMTETIRERERRLADAHAEVGGLLDAMRHAVFGFSSDLVVAGRCSRAAEQLFGRDIAGVDVRELLLAGQPEGSLEAEALLAFLETVFDVSPAAWGDVLQLAPRELCSYPGTPQERVLALEFVPLHDDATLHRVMVVVTDETEQRRVSREMSDLRERHAAELDATRRLLGMGAGVFVEFATTTEARLRTLDELATDPTPPRVDEMLRQVHAARGDARGLGLVSLARTLAAAEAVLAEVRDSGDPPPLERWRPVLREHTSAARVELGRERGRLVAASPLGEAVLDQMTVSARDLDDLHALTEDAGPAVRRCVERLRGRWFGALLLGLEDAAGSWASVEGKRVRIEIAGGATRIDASLCPALRTAIVQLIRNAIAHGIEPPEQRVAADKPSVGCIRIAAQTVGDALTIEVTDDGAGMDRSRLRARADAMGIEVPSHELPFVSGLSTRSEANNLAGRGVGLAAARDELARSGYGIEIDSEPGRRTTARIFCIAANARRSSRPHRRTGTRS